MGSKQRGQACDFAIRSFSLALIRERRSWVRPAILQFSPGLVSWKHEKVEIAELQA
jgi:hypothetical protein